MKALARFFGGKKKAIGAPSNEKAKTVNEKSKTASTAKASKQSKSRESIESSSSGSDLDMIVEIEENERFHPKFKWSAENLKPDDPKRYISSAGESNEFPDLPIADGWEYSGSWYYI